MEAGVREELIQGGCVPSMLSVVRGHAELNPTMVRDAMLSLGNLSALPSGAAALLNAKGGIAAILPGLSSTDPETARLAALVVANVAASGDAGRLAVCDAGLVTPMLALLRSGDSLTLRFAMGALREVAALPAGRAEVRSTVESSRSRLHLTPAAAASLLRCLLTPSPTSAPPPSDAASPQTALALGISGHPTRDGIPRLANGDSPQAAVTPLAPHRPSSSSWSNSPAEGLAGTRAHAGGARWSREGEPQTLSPDGDESRCELSLSLSPDVEAGLMHG
ncbi:hypothetical protein T484DRAFT_1966301 [Baffinella frigidus]|nr:hypothetical protein T484DRAFT_1966301 [Cryptophyta sp. CCMP2293]